ncbi:hypothetical protein [Natrialbaceae archaeon AArc-T1-2]|uniref:hypothetical protein n=1 Tax=Natrialbaceae archaeon AArc-T1-2 TaxID=3053904 RepID=UPI00255AEED6|nr:hypothetical protein [Natrialbaceae archaeon AArc-T1-2]WIV67363.1 hypothetical protein QQ977_01145 [Natrialbaceae archaeon AArc-T1-2]
MGCVARVVSVIVWVLNSGVIVTIEFTNAEIITGVVTIGSVNTGVSGVIVTITFTKKAIFADIVTIRGVMKRDSIVTVTIETLKTGFSVVTVTTKTLETGCVVPIEIDRLRYCGAVWCRYGTGW